MAYACLLGGRIAAWLGPWAWYVGYIAAKELGGGRARLGVWEEKICYRVDDLKGYGYRERLDVPGRVRSAAHYLPTG